MKTLMIWLNNVKNYCNIRKKIVKYGKCYLEVDVPDYANGETLSECVVVEPLNYVKEHKETFIDKIVKFFNKLVF